jgi:K+-sensing histidine kinase KdpD
MFDDSDPDDAFPWPEDEGAGAATPVDAPVAILPVPVRRSAPKFESDAWPEFLQLALTDLQNPLAVLDVSIRLLNEDLAVADPETLATLRCVESAIRRIQRYVDHLVTAEQFAAGNLSPRIDLVDLSTMLTELVEEVQRNTDGAGCDVRVDDSIPRGLLVPADEALLLRIFQSLLEHATCRLVKGGRLLVHVEAGAFVEIRISNDGPSLSLTERRRIFEKLGAGFGGRRGAGPSLYFCRLAVEAQGGTVSLEESGEWPTTFVVRLPLEPL